MWLPLNWIDFAWCRVHKRNILSIAHTHIEFFILSNHYWGSSSLAEINGHICGLRLKSLVLLFYQDAQIQYFLLGMLILAGGPWVAGLNDETGQRQIAGQNEIRRDFTNSIAALHMAAQSVYKGICFHWWNKMYMSPPFSTEIWCQVVVCRIRKAFVLSKQGLPHCPLASTLPPSLHHSLIAANLATFIYTIVLTSKPL